MQIPYATSGFHEYQLPQLAKDIPGLKEGTAYYFRLCLVGSCETVNSDGSWTDAEWYVYYKPLDRSDRCVAQDYVRAPKCKEMTDRDECNARSDCAYRQCEHKPRLLRQDGFLGRADCKGLLLGECLKVPGCFLDDLDKTFPCIGLAWRCDDLNDKTVH